MNIHTPRFRYKLLSRDPALQITDIDKCLYAVSISDDGRTLDKALAGLLWAKNRFPECSVLLGDSLFRFAKDLEAGAPNSVSSESDALISDTENQIRAVAGASIEIISTSELQNDIRYSGFLSGIKSDYHRDKTFKKSVNNTASAYVERQLAGGRLKPELRAAALDRSKEYLLREIAIYDLLACDGWLTDVYFGKEIEPLAQIISGAITNCGKMLHMRNNISLRTR